MHNHIRESNNKVNTNRRALLKLTKINQDNDGLSSISYNLLETVHHKLYTKFIVSYDEKELFSNEKLYLTKVNLTYIAT